MNAADKLKVRFYQHLGELFYAIAMADDHVRPQEETQLQQLIDKEWRAIEQGEDEFHTNAVYQMETVFENLNESFVDAETAFEDFKFFKMEHEHLFTPAITKLILKTANAIADSFNGKNKSELIFLGKLDRLMKEHAK
jgi:hypothetical protein